MAVDYASAKTALVAWVRNAAGSYLYQGASGNALVFWSEEDHDYALTPYAELEFGDEIKRGRDETTWEYQADTDTVAPRVSGLREAVVSVTVRSRDAREGNAARNALSALQSSLEDPLHMATLREDGGLSFIRVELFTTNNRVERDGRRESVARMDVRFGMSAVAFDAAHGAPWVRNVGLTNEIEKTDGTPVDPSASEEPVGVDYPPPGS